MSLTHPYLAIRDLTRGGTFNRWDAVAFALVFAALTLIALGARHMTAPLTSLSGQLSLSPWYLPYYALRTTLRMLAALILSVVFSISYSYIAAKSKRAERVLIPLLDILQSVPILGFLSFTVTFFLGLFPGRVFGAELASIFVIFTSQAWNITFSLYQSQRTLPSDLVEVSRSLRLTAWQRFWKLEMPFAMPGMVWNMMMSMSGGWFFIVASEAITVGNHTVILPGIGSYVATAIAHRNLDAIGWAILTMLLVILVYDQLLFRPLVAWSERFRVDDEPLEIETQSWILRTIQRSTWPTAMIEWASRVASSRPRISRKLAKTLRVPGITSIKHSGTASDFCWYAVVIGTTMYGAWRIYEYLSAALPLHAVIHAIELGFFTLIRVLVLVGLASLIWVPVGVAIGLRPRVAAIVQPAAQFLAAFPANLFFPIFVALIVHFRLNPDIWLSPLMILGTQWYILFNVVAGASQLPRDLRDAARNLQMHGWLWWRRVMLPAILPFYVTGAMTAAGGAWNASIVAEFVEWGTTHLQANGLGAYIEKATIDGNYPHIVLGVAVMSIFVVTLNRTLWRPLYRRSEERVELA